MFSLKNLARKGLTHSHASPGLLTLVYSDWQTEVTEVTSGGRAGSVEWLIYRHRIFQCVTITPIQTIG